MSRGFHPAAMRGFELLFLPWMRRRLHAVQIAGLPGRIPADRPLMLVSNHVSWWDAFALREVQRLLRPGAPVHTVMLESELRRRPLFRGIGAVGLRPGSPASVARCARELERRAAERPDSVVLFFPQGRIWPSHRRPLGFQRGVELFARRLAPLVVLPVGLHLEPLTSAAPSLFAAAAPPLEVGGGDPVRAAELESRVEEQLDRVLALLARHGEDAARAWPGPREPLPHAPAERLPLGEAWR